MLRLISPRAYKVIKFVLEHREFKQWSVHEQTGVSFGWVNFITNWLVSHGYAARREGQYKLLAPTALAQQFSFFRRMEQLRFASFEVETNEAELSELLSKTNAVLCLTSALQRYDDYFRDPSVHAYAGEKTAQALRALPLGNTRVDLYADDLKQEDDFEKPEILQVRPAYGSNTITRLAKESVGMTKKTRTIIDVLCSQRAYAADELIKKTWG